jgi:hypothetical protein
LPFELNLVSLNLHVLVGGLIIPALQLVTDHRPGAEPEKAADGRAGARMANRRTDETASRRAAKRANARALLSGG